MSLAGKRAAVLAAELRCEGQRQAAQDALATLKSEFRRSATPVRIVASGLALGFASGLRKPGAGAAASLGGQFLTGPLFSMLLETVLPGLLAGITAAATADADDDAGADDAEAEDEGGGEDGVDPGAEADAGTEPAPAPGRHRSRHVDA